MHRTNAFVREGEPGLLVPTYDDDLLRRDVRFIVQRWAMKVSESMGVSHSAVSRVADEDIVWILKVLYEDNAIVGERMRHLSADVIDIVGSRVIQAGSPEVRCTLDTIWSATCRIGPNDAVSRRMCVRYACEQGRLLERWPDHLTHHPTEVLLSSFTTLIMCGVKAVSFGRAGHEEVYARLLFMYSESVWKFVTEADARLRRMPTRCFSEHRSALETEEVYALLSLMVVYGKVTCQLLRRLPWTFGMELVERNVLDTLVALSFTHAGQVIADDVTWILRTMHSALETGYVCVHVCEPTSSGLMSSVVALRMMAGSRADFGTRVCFPEKAARTMGWRELHAR